MPEESNGAGAPQAQQPAEGQQPEGGSPQPPAPTPQPAPEPKPDSANQLIKQFVKERGITVEDLLQQITDRENAERTELETLTTERDDYKGRYEALEAKYRESRAESAFIAAAAEADARDAETLFLAYKGRLAYDDEGKPTNVADIITELRSQKPGLFRLPEGDGGAGTGGGTSTDFNTMIRRAAGRKG